MKYTKFGFGVFVFLLVFGYVNHLLLASVKPKNITFGRKDFKVKEIESFPASTTTVTTIPAGASYAVDLIPNSTPVKISIPSVKIMAAIKTVGTTTSGNMAVPKKFSDVGWYKYGRMPGEEGNTIIAGHYESAVNKNGFVKGGPFQNLSKVKVGSDIYVTSENGKKVRYTVSSKKIYGKDESTNKIFSNGDEAKLILITCNGTWLPKEKTFSERLVVTADLSEDKVKLK